VITKHVAAGSRDHGARGHAMRWRSDHVTRSRDISFSNSQVDRLSRESKRFRIYFALTSPRKFREDFYSELNALLANANFHYTIPCSVSVSHIFLKSRQEKNYMQNACKVYRSRPTCATTINKLRCNIKRFVLESEMFHADERAL